MKAWKTVTIVALALVTVALVTASAFAYMGEQGFYSPYGTYANGGMMGGAYSYPPYPTQPNAPAYQYQYGGGCHGRSGWNGYVGSEYSNNEAAITIETAVTVAQRYLTSLNIRF